MNDNLIPKTDGQTGGQNSTPTNLPGENFTNSNLGGNTNTETTPAFIGMNSPQSQPAKPVEHIEPTEPVKPVQSSAGSFSQSGVSSSAPSAASSATNTSSPYSSFGSSTTHSSSHVSASSAPTPSASISSTPSASVPSTPSASVPSTPSSSISSTPSAFASHTTSTSSTFSNSTPPVGTARPSAYTPVTHINTHPHSMAKVLGTIISVFIILLLIGGGYYFYATRSTSAPEDVPLEDNKSAFPPAVTGTNTRPVATTTQQNPSRVPTARESFNTYIRQNINSLSPIKTTGTFTVSNVRFDGANRAMVTYTDGRNTYNAAVNYAVNGTNVTVTDFTVLTK